MVEAVLATHMPPIPGLEPFTARMLPGINNAAMKVLSKHPIARATTLNPLPVGQIEHQVIPGPQGDILLQVLTRNTGSWDRLASRESPTTRVATWLRP